MTPPGGCPDRQGVGVQEDQPGAADGVPVGGRAMVTQSLEAGDIQADKQRGLIADSGAPVLGLGLGLGPEIQALGKLGRLVYRPVLEGIGYYAGHYSRDSVMGAWGSGLRVKGTCDILNLGVVWLGGKREQGARQVFTGTDFDSPWYRFM